MIEENEELWDSYLYEGTTVLKNKLDIKDEENLKEVEATISFEKLYDLMEKPPEFHFSKEHLKYLHKYIFGDIYPFAGEYRYVNIQKQIGSFFHIDHSNKIDDFLDNVFTITWAKLNNSNTEFEFADTLGYLYTQLIYCHPFREGNGRTIREFVREFSYEMSKDKPFGPVEVDWRKVDREELNRYLDVAHIYPGATALLIKDALVKADERKKSL